MKIIAIFLISVYQGIFSPVIKQLLGISSSCRHSPTCSTYAKQSLIKYGMIKGSAKALRRLLSCHPFAQ